MVSTMRAISFGLRSRFSDVILFGVTRDGSSRCPVFVGGKMSTLRFAALALVGVAPLGLAYGACVPNGLLAPLDAGNETSVDAAPTATLPSCVGLPKTCGPNGDDDCCATTQIPGGPVARSAAGAAWDGPTAQVSAFSLDKYEVTVGRFRAFVASGMGTQASPPLDDAGASAKIAASGWRPTYNAFLPVDTQTLRLLLECNGAAQTWTDAPGAHETYPLNCTSWFIAFAFCAWDGGRLPTEAEWVFAAAAGSEQRQFPWSADASVIDPTYAIYGCTDGGACLPPVGSRPKGAGLYGNLDLAGSLHEWTLDFYHPNPPSPCVDCADLTAAGSSGVSFHGGSFSDIPSNLKTWTRFYTFDLSTASKASSTIGIRCAR
jgi:formylglycine-generating enzyme